MIGDEGGGERDGLSTLGGPSEHSAAAEEGGGDVERAVWEKQSKVVRSETAQIRPGSSLHAHLC